ncbi:hypothetical protein GCM10022631_43580 [Deinococcus rubellus]|uniref:Uncharacterized protein n=1 Tax=Deinococcus rubellus TaxID=1889240 RepID=A0ABY5YJQ1_9DEIO|nr:hypothetical protein [Deinococcus rubellus]UWX65171.1 hypothetical protein N0D28_05805 [Deinococcus rubellus]
MSHGSEGRRTNRDALDTATFEIQGSDIINQLVSLAVAEKVTALMTEDDLKVRAARASRKKFDAAMARTLKTVLTPAPRLPLSKSGSYGRVECTMSLRNTRMNRTALEVATFETQSSDLEYWLARPPVERLEALELLRQIHYGYDPATARLQRVLAVIESASG